MLSCGHFYGGFSTARMLLESFHIHLDFASATWKSCVMALWPPSSPAFFLSFLSIPFLFLFLSFLFLFLVIFPSSFSFAKNFDRCESGSTREKSQKFGQCTDKL